MFSRRVINNKLKLVILDLEVNVPCCLMSQRSGGKLSSGLKGGGGLTNIGSYLPPSPFSLDIKNIYFLAERCLPSPPKKFFQISQLCELT